MNTKPFVPPVYPYERLNPLRELAAVHDGGVIDCSVGTPCDPPLSGVVDALSHSNAERGYPTSAGSLELRTAIVDWFHRRFGIDLKENQAAICIGTKEFVASTASSLALRNPERRTLLFPDVSYPTYELSALLAGLRPVRVPLEKGRLCLEALDSRDVRDALMLWSNSPSNPTGHLDDLGHVAQWGRKWGIPVFSDECYCDFTWSKDPETILQQGFEGVVAVHSLSKRSNLAGLRVGFYAGDQEIITFLRSVRQHAGLMVPGPAQKAAIVALGDDDHVVQQRERYARRLTTLRDALCAVGLDCILPDGGFYLWVRVPASFADAWAVADYLATTAGLVVSPGEFYGPSASRFVRIAVVQPDEMIERAASRLLAAASS